MIKQFLTNSIYNSLYVRFRNLGFKNIGLKKIYTDNILKNSIYLIMANFSGLALGFIFWMIATKLYTPSDIGMVSATLSSMILISMVSCVGLPIAMTLYLPVNAQNANRIMNSCLIVGIIVSMTFSLIFILGIDIWAPKLEPMLGNYKLMIIFIITTVMTTVSLFMGGMFTAGKRSSFHMIKENVFSSTKIVMLILLSGFGAIGILMSWSIGLMITIPVGFFLLFKLWRYKPTLVFDPIIKNMAKFSIESYIAGIFYNIPKFIFPIIIINTLSTESAGYFFIAMTIAGIFYGVPEAVMGPFLAESSDKEKFWNNVNKAIKFDIYLLIPGLLLLMIFGKFVLNIFNPNYAEHSLNTLIILSMVSIPMSLIAVYNMIRSSQKKVVAAIKVEITIATITIILSMYFMRIWNIEGIAMAYLAANTLAAIVIVLRTKNPIEFTSRLIKREKMDKNVCRRSVQ